MSEQEILEKAIRKVQAKGFTGFPITASEYNADIFTAAVSGMIESKKVNNLIFDHNFAKHFFGEETERLWECPECGYSFEYYKHNETQQYCSNDGRKVVDVTKPISKWEQPWLRHLQDMVAEDEPIEYISNFLENRNADN